MVLIAVPVSHLHDPLHRHLIDDENADEQRTWCVVHYSPSWNRFNSAVTLNHTLIPFAMNLFCTIFMIAAIAHSRVTVQPTVSLTQHLQLQFKQHQHRVIASVTLVVLAIPQLAISFNSGCMKSPRNSWLYLLAYLMAFVPSMMTFLIYILPSKLYKDDCDMLVLQTRRRFRRRI